MSGFQFLNQKRVCTHACTCRHFLYSQLDRLTSTPKAFWLVKRDRVLLFSLWFSYYTEINTVKLFCATQGLWTQREWALNAFISLSLPYLLLFPCLFDTHAHKPHIFRHYQTNSWNYGETRCMHQASVGVEECVQWLIRRRIWQQH